VAELVDSDIARVLRAAAGRTSPTDNMTQSVYEAVHAEWRATVGKQKRKRSRRLWLALAASVAVGTLALFLTRNLIRSPGALMADVSRTIGEVQIREGDASDWQDAVSANKLRVGERIHTGASGRLTLTLRDGVSLRLDHDTDLALVGRDRVDVTSGAVYIDSGATGASRGRLQVWTPAGTVQHIGTQYEARILKGGTRVRVREGRVDVKPVNAPSQTLEVGDQIVVSDNGIQQRSRIEARDREWDWASQLAPTFDINGKPLEAFLFWAGRETGLKIVFATPESETEARRATLSGSINGLDPNEALAAVLPTTSLRGTEHDGTLVVGIARH
jgi:ferric-dicitrate binding protein FerR (iron transport regulator)